MPQFENAYHQQLTGFYTELNPTPLQGTRLLYHSEPLAGTGVGRKLVYPG